MKINKLDHETSSSTSQTLTESVNDTLLSEAIDRSILISYVFAAGYIIYGISSLSFIQKFDPTVTLWQNLWPRLLFNFIPSFLLAKYLNNIKVSKTIRFYIWAVCFFVIFQVSAWIHVWPIVLNKSPDVIIFADAANVYVFAFTYAIVAPPGKLIISFTIILTLFFILPLFYIVYLSNSPVILNSIVGDTIIATASGVIFSRIISKLRLTLYKLQLEKQDKASKFLDPIVAEAVFKDRPELLRKKRAKAFVVTMDVRDSTELIKIYEKRWLVFRQDYFKEVSILVSKHAGYIQKTVGDCHVINFGMNDEIDLSDIPGLDTENARADERKMQYYSEMTLKCMNGIFETFTAISKKHFPELDIKLGAGLDRGTLERDVQGSEEARDLDLDYNGTMINCSNRLQEFTKELYKQNICDQTSSILIVSPYGADFINARDLALYKRVAITNPPIRNFPGIRWILVKEFKAKKLSTHQNSESQAA